MTRAAVRRSIPARQRRSGASAGRGTGRPRAQARPSSTLSATGSAGRPSTSNRAGPVASTSAAADTSSDVDVDELSIQLTKSLQKIGPKRDKTNDALKAVRSYSDKLVSDTRVSHQNKQKMVALYETVGKQVRSESDTFRRALEQIRKITEQRMQQSMKSPLSRGTLIGLLNSKAQTLPLYVGGVVGHPPPGVGAIPVPDSEKIQSGTMVAAFAGDDWILASVNTQLPNGKYELKDVDITTSRDNTASRDAMANEPAAIVLPRKKLIPLPKYRADPERDGHALFPVNAVVLALYPQTTCFYKAVVIKQPLKATDPYYVAFEDRTFDSGYSPEYDVTQRYVVTYKQMKMPKET